MKNNFQAVQFAKHFLRKQAPYWYGTFGQTASEQLYKEKKNQYKDQYPPQKWTEESFTKDYGERVFDCIGLAVKGYQFNKDNDFDADPVYNPNYDVSADGFLALCVEKGPYDQIPDIPGIIVHKKHHVGIYIGTYKGEKYVIECKGHAYGTVETTVTPWTEWCKCPWWEYITVESWLTSLYKMVLGRDPDKEGLDYWCGEINKLLKTPTEVLRFFLNSPEFSNRKLNDKEFINVLYEVFFDRAPDKDGFNFWIGKLEGGTSRADIIEDFLGTGEWHDMEEYLLYVS